MKPTRTKFFPIEFLFFLLHEYFFETSALEFFGPGTSFAL